jgi:hypothetical protein
MRVDTDESEWGEKCDEEKFRGESMVAMPHC